VATGSGTPHVEENDNDDKEGKFQHQALLKTEKKFKK
jgi:hypothetical protein